MTQVKRKASYELSLLETENSVIYDLDGSATSSSKLSQRGNPTGSVQPDDQSYVKLIDAAKLAEYETVYELYCKEKIAESKEEMVIIPTKEDRTPARGSFCKGIVKFT